MRHAVLASVLAALTTLSHAAAQQPRAALTRDSVRVGDPFGVVVQFDVPAGAELLIPDTIDVFGDVENAAAKRVRIDTLADGTLRYLVTYPLAAWRPGQQTLPHISATVRTTTDQQTFDVALPSVSVTTVLPPDTTNIEAKPPRDVWGASRLWWPIILALLVLLALIVLAIWWWRRRQRTQAVAPVEAILPVPPRDWALRELARIRAEGYVERNELRRFYIELSQTLRGYSDRLDPAWGEDLTTTELMHAMRPNGPEVEPLLRVLQRADLVKFARETVSPADARSDLETAAQWVETFNKSEWLIAEAA